MVVVLDAIIAALELFERDVSAFLAGWEGADHS